MNSCAVNGIGLFPAPSFGSAPSSQPTEGMRKAWRYMLQNKYMRMAAVMLAGCNAAMYVRARTWPRKGGLLPLELSSQAKRQTENRSR